MRTRIRGLLAAAILTGGARRLLTPGVAMLGDPAARRRLPFTSSHFPEPIDVEGIDVEGHVLWGMTLRLLDDLVPRLLAGEWDV